MKGSAACTVHSGGGSGGSVDSLESLIAQANDLMATVRTYLDTVQTLPLIDRALLEGGIIQLREAVWARDVQRIQRYHSELSRNYTILSSQYPPPPVNPPIPEQTPDPITGSPLPTPTPSPDDSRVTPEPTVDPLLPTAPPNIP
jgi:hypothetical protein